MEQTDVRDVGAEAAPIAPEDGVAVSGEMLSYDAFRREWQSGLDAILRAVKVTKNKDAANALLSREIQGYREGFAFKLVRPLCTALIGYREDCRKTLSDVEDFAKDGDTVIRYLEFLRSDYEELLSNQGLERTEDGGFELNGENLDDLPRREEKPEEEQEAAPAADAPAENAPAADAAEPAAEEVAAEEAAQEAKSPTFETLLATVREGLAAVEKALHEIDEKDEAALAAARKSEAIDRYYADAVRLPLFRRMATLYDQMVEKIAEVSETAADAPADAYADVLELLVDESEEILRAAGVEILSEIGDEYDIKSSKILRVVPTDDPEKDRRVAKRHTDCYRYEEKILYPAKVDVYKYTPAN